MPPPKAISPFQHNEYTGTAILDEKGRPKLRIRTCSDTLDDGESSFVYGLPDRQSQVNGKNGRRRT